VTEAAWLACPDPDRLLAFLGDQVGQRIRRRFACACCRRVWHLLGDERSRNTVEVAERVADGHATPGELEAARVAALAAWHAAWAGPAGEAEWDPARDAAWVACATASDGASAAAAAAAGWKIEPGVRADLFRDIFNMWPPALNPAWFTWQGGTVPKVAQGIHDERAFDRFSILADALEEAGCDNAEILSHLRGPGPHCRGCWCLDLLLGKE